MSNTNKRKIEEEVDESKVKRQRRRKRSQSEPRYDTNNPEKREVLWRLFGRYCAAEDNDDGTEDSSDEEVEGGEEDPLLDNVPVNLDPEQLGFLLCAQETIRFLRERGLTLRDPMLARLRQHFISSMYHITMA